MRNKKVAAGNHLLLLSCSGAWSYGFRHYPHGPFQAMQCARYIVLERLSPMALFINFSGANASQSILAVLLAQRLGASRQFPDRQPVLAAAGLRPRQPRLSATSDCGARIGDFKSLANMTPPSSVPKYGGSRFMLPHFHKSTNQVKEITNEII